MVRQGTTPTPGELFAAYCRLWACSELVVNYGTMFLSPGCGAFTPSECASTPFWFYGQVVLWLALVLRPTRATAVAAMLVRVNKST